MYWYIVLQNIKLNTYYKDIDFIDTTTLKLFLNDKQYITFNLIDNIWNAYLDVGKDLTSVENNLNYIKLITNKLKINNISCNCVIKNDKYISSEIYINSQHCL